MKVNINDIKKSTGLSLAFTYDDKLKLDDPELTFELQADLKFTNVGNGNILLQGNLKAATAQICSRCADSYNHVLSVELCEEFVPQEDERLNQDEDLNLEDLNFFALEDEYIDIGEVIRQNLISALPLKPLCRGNCKGLCPQCGNNLNLRPCTCVPGAKDSRWQPFKNLKK